MERFIVILSLRNAWIVRIVAWLQIAGVDFDQNRSMAAEDCGGADEVHVQHCCRRRALVIVAIYNFCPAECPLFGRRFPDSRQARHGGRDACAMACHGAMP
jgi:hypothetical protein